MDIWGIVIATIVVGATGIIIGLLLGVAGEKFKVEVNEKELFIRDLLPGNNCGGCGFAGCDGHCCRRSSCKCLPGGRRGLRFQDRRGNGRGRYQHGAEGGFC